MTTSRSHVDRLRDEEEGLTSGLRRVRAELREAGLLPATFVDGTGHTADAAWATAIDAFVETNSQPGVKQFG